MKRPIDFSALRSWYRDRYGTPSDVDRATLALVQFLASCGFAMVVWHNWRVQDEPSAWYLIERDFVDQDSTGGNHYFEWIVGAPYKRQESCASEVRDDRVCRLLPDSEASSMPRAPLA